MAMRAALRIGAELAAVGLVLASLAGAWGLVATMQRRAAAPPRAEQPAVVVAAPLAPVDPAPPKPAPAPAAPVETAPDPTPAELARLEGLRREQTEQAARLDAQAEASAQAAKTIGERLEALRTRAQLLEERRGQLQDRMAQTEELLDRLAKHRDVLIRTRDDAKKELAQSRSSDGFAVLPHRSANGTWKRPIPIECKDGSATIQPGGPTFSLVDMAALGVFRSNPLAVAVGRYATHAQSGRSPDGAVVVPYVLFIIRPDGIRPYYEARGTLESLGLSFGYELVEQDAVLNFPDLDDPAEWSEEAPPPRFARDGWPGTQPAPGTGSGSGTGDDPYVWTARPMAGGPGGGGGEGGENDGGPPGLFPADLAGLGDQDDAGEGVPGGKYETGRLGTGGPGGGTARPPLGPGTRGGAAGGSLAGLGGRAGGSPFSTSPKASGDGIGGGGPRATIDRPAMAANGTGTGQGGAAAVSGGSSGGGGRGAVIGTPGAGRALAQRRGAVRGGGTAAGGLDLAGSPGEGKSGGGGGVGPSGGGQGSGVDGSTFRMERPMELVVACGPGGLTIQPGGHRLSRSNLEPADARLVELLRELVRRRETREPPEVKLTPRLTFLVQPGGQETYWQARRQTLMAGLGWPIRLRVQEGEIMSELLPEGRLR